MSRKNIFKRFVIERVMVNSLIILSVFGLFDALKSKPQKEYLVTFFFLRISIGVLAHVFSFVRHSKFFYFPGLKEMPIRTYWIFVNLILFATRPLLLSPYVKQSFIFYLVDYSMLAGIIGLLLMSYQSQPWAVLSDKQRINQIKFLVGPRKANLTQNELVAVVPILIEKGKARQKKPLIWILTEILLVVIIGVTLDSYASNIVDFVEKIYIQFPNILPPY